MLIGAALTFLILFITKFYVQLQSTPSCAHLHFYRQKFQYRLSNLKWIWLKIKISRWSFHLKFTSCWIALDINLFFFCSIASHRIGYNCLFILTKSREREKNKTRRFYFYSKSHFVIDCFVDFDWCSIFFCI